MTVFRIFVMFLFGSGRRVNISGIMLMPLYVFICDGRNERRKTKKQGKTWLNNIEIDPNNKQNVIVARRRSYTEKRWRGRERERHDGEQ